MKKEKLVFATIWLIAFVAGSVIGHGIGFMMFDQRHHPHLCRCEACKVTRQLEACEVIDSIIKERVVINVIERESE